MVVKDFILDLLLFTILSYHLVFLQTQPYLACNLNSDGFFNAVVIWDLFLQVAECPTALIKVAESHSFTYRLFIMVGSSKGSSEPLPPGECQ